MPSAELAPAPHTETQEVTAESFPHFGIPGFEKLPPETQSLYLKIPASRLDASRPIIEREIAKASETSEKVDQSEAKKSQGRNIETVGGNREAQANTAIETFHRAEAGDPEAKKDLLDQKKELLNEESPDDEIFQTILESQSSNPFVQDMTLEVMLSDEEAQAHQDVLDMFKDFRGDLPSVDDAIKPELQIDLFLELTKGHGTLIEREYFTRQALTMLTDHGRRNLRDGLKEYGVLGDGGLLESGVDKLRELASISKVTPQT